MENIKVKKERANKDYFFCYDRKLACYLIYKDFSYITEALHCQSGSKFWLFKQSEKLSTALRKFKTGGSEIKYNAIR